MLEFAIGIPLTTAAWARGWKGWALLPLAAYLPICYVVGFLSAYLFGPEAMQSLAGIVAIMIFVAVCMTLIVMIVRPRKPKTNRQVIVTTDVNVNDAAKRYCPRCGREQNDNALFCRSCGRRLGAGDV